MPVLPAAHSLPKEERLHGKKDISALLADGKWGTQGCLRYCSKPNSLEYSRIMVSVPKRLFKRAVKRNLLKRRIREAYRQNKPAGVPGTDIFLQFNAPQAADFPTIMADVVKILEKVSK